MGIKEPSLFVSSKKGFGHARNVEQSWFCQGEARTTVQAQIVGGRWVRAFQFRRELSSILDFFGKWIRLDKLRPRRRFFPGSVIDDVLLAFLPLACVLANLRAKISPLVVASHASEWRLGLSRISSLMAQGQVALQELHHSTPESSGSVGLTELFAGLGGLRRAMEHCDVFVAVHIAVKKDAPAQPDVQLIDRVADLSNNTLPHMI